MAGIADMLIGGFEAGTRLRQNREAEQKQKGIASLFQQAYQAPVNQQRGFVSQAMGLDPQAGMQLNKGLNADNETRAHRLVGMAEAITQTPEELRPQMWAKMLPELQSFGLPVSEQYDPSIMDAAQQILAAAYGPDASQVPAGFDAAHRTLIAAGFQPGTPEYERGMRIEAGLEPGFGKSAPRSLNVDINGVPTQVTFDPTTRQYIPAMVGGSPMGAPQGGDPFGFLAQAGATVTSGLRTPERNAKVGGVPNSYHLSGQARDILPPRDPQQAAFIRQQAAANGLEVIDEGDHWHLEPRPGTPIIGRRKEDEAAATEAAKIGVQLQALPTELGMRTNAAIAQTRGTEQAKVDVGRAAAEPARREKVRQILAKTANLDRTIDDAIGRVDGLTAGFIGSMADEIPGTPANDLRVTVNTIKANLAFDALQAMREASPTGGALGAVSERELGLLESAVASLDQSQTPAQMRAALKRVKQHYNAWAQAVRQADQEASRPAPSSSGNVLRFNPETGDFE